MKDAPAPLLARVVERLQAEIGAEAASEERGERLQQRISLLAQAIESGRGCGDWGSLGAADAAELRWLLDRIRDDLTAESAALVDPLEASGLLAMLRAIEVTRQSLDRRPDARIGRLLSSLRGLDLLQDLAHDLRSPLTSILFLSEALREERSGPVNELQRRQLGLLYTAALGLSSMANDVIDVVRLQPGDLTGEITPFSITSVLESIRDLVQPVAETRGLELKLHCLAHDRRYGEPVSLTRVLLNLTSNALKFTDQGYVRLEAREVEGTAVRFSVQDSGRGLDPDAVARLSRDVGASDPAEYAPFAGRGLGLTICRKLLSPLGSTLQFETRAGGGTRFYFDVNLPRA